MNLRHAAPLTLLVSASTASVADNFTTALDLSLGNASYGRNNAVGSFVDTYTFTLVGSPYFAGSTASSASSGLQNLDFSGLVIRDAGNNVVATFAGNLGTPSNELYSLSQTTLSAGAYSLIVTGVNSPAQASYTGNLAISASPVPEPSSLAMMLAGLGAAVLVVRSRRPG